MSILNHTKRMAERQATQNEVAMKQAIEMFSSQKESFNAFKNSEAMKSIRRFFEAEKELCERVFREGTKPEYTMFVQGQYSKVMKFLDFLKGFDL